MNLDIAIKERYSCRTYKTKELTELQIRTILDAARHAPSPKNRQPWRFVVLRQKDKDEFLKKNHNPFSNNSIQLLFFWTPMKYFETTNKNGVGIK